MSEQELNNPKFKNTFDQTRVLENTEASIKWSKDNAKSIQSKREKYFKKWQKKKMNRKND